MKRSMQCSWLAFAALASFVLAGQVVAQPQPGGPGGPPQGGFGGPGGFGGGGVLGIAMRDEVQQELQLVDEQKDKVRTITEAARDKVRDEMRSVFEQMRDLGDDERRAKFDEIRTKMDSLNVEGEKELAKILLPHQMERLKQIDLQTKIRYRGSSALTGGDIAKALNLTDEQREKLEKRAVEVQEELQTKIRELQVEARKKMIDVLTPDQQAQLQKMMGDNFDLPDQGFRSRFGRGGGGSEGQGRGGRDRGNRPGGERPAQEGRESI